MVTSTIAALVAAWLAVLNATVALSSGDATTVVEAVLLALSAAAIAIVCVRGAVRARRRPRLSPPRGPAPATPPDDPLGWVRKRRFGAR